ncbi:hypothetical protein Q7P35_010546 [Cladosporium inversicolor]
MDKHATWHRRLEQGDIGGAVALNVLGLIEVVDITQCTGRSPDGIISADPSSSRVLSAARCSKRRRQSRRKERASLVVPTRAHVTDRVDFDTDSPLPLPPDELASNIADPDSQSRSFVKQLAIHDSAVDEVDVDSTVTISEGRYNPDTHPSLDDLASNDYANDDSSLDFAESILDE